MKEWSQISKGDSNGLQALSDFLGQCEEAMRSIQSLNELNSIEVLRQVSSKIPSYSGVKWFRHDPLKFIRAEVDLATGPVFSLDVLKMEKKRVLRSRKQASTQPEQSCHYGRRVKGELEVTSWRKD